MSRIFLKVLLPYFAVYILCVEFAASKPNPDETGNKLQGDILRSKKRFEYRLSGNRKSTGIVDKQFRWVDKRLPYIISPDFRNESRKKILNAMKEVENKTCVRFVPRKQEEDYIYIENGDGCESYVGKQGGEQNVSLNDPGCMTHGVILHELIHAIGFEHEQSRSDRGMFITVLWGNVKTGMENNFEKYTSSEINHYNMPYDYSSIMHYSDEAFQKNGHDKTLLIPRTGVTVGQRSHMTAIDREKINRMYDCHKKLSKVKQKQNFN